jgi:hypothetical protein
MVSRDDVIRMAREAGIAGPNSRIGDDFIVYWGTLELFANLIASHVAEECAQYFEERKSIKFYGDDAADAIRSLYKPTA